MTSPIDVILTSCNRFDLLERTLDSFFAYNTAYIGKFLVYDDAGDKRDEANLIELSGKYPSVTFQVGEYPVGQIYALDHLTKQVTTPYYFTLEDDWEFYRHGFIEDSIAVLEKHPDIIQCWLREQGDTNGHPVYKYKDYCSLMSTKYSWKGFSFNPAVRRLDDYIEYSSIAKFDPKDPAKAERLIGEHYYKQGYKAAILPKGYVRHIGEGRGIR